MRAVLLIAAFLLTCCTSFKKEHREALHKMEPIPSPLFDLLMQTEFPKLTD